MPKEHGILFQLDMVRAILERRKNQTRRTPNRFNAKWQVGGHLWVKERWCTLEKYDGLSPSDVPVGAPVAYLAGPRTEDERSRVFSEWRQAIFMPRWASRLTLVVLAVREQRLQEITEEDAVAEGSVADPPEIWWQGYREWPMEGLGTELMHQQTKGDAPPEWMVEPHRMLDRPDLRTSARTGFRYMWDSINAKRGYPWESNPMVRAFTFKVVKGYCDV